MSPTELTEDERRRVGNAPPESGVRYLSKSECAEMDCPFPPEEE